MPMKKKILIVDDQEINRNILNRILQDEFTVIQASNGKEALDIMMKENDLAAVLLDLMMPQLDGYGVLDKMREEDLLFSLPVIIATQQENDETEVNVLAKGAWDYVTKPYKPAVIKQRLRNLIQIKEATKTIDILKIDELTGLLNKEGFYHSIKTTLEEFPRNDYDLVVIDVDRFKLINDTYGVKEGNKLLKYIATLLYGFVEDQDGFCARFNADQFMAFLPRKKNTIWLELLWETKYILIPES